MSSANAEILQTIKAVTTFPGEKYTAQRNSLKGFLASACTNLGSLTEPQLEAVLSLVPEMTSPKVSIGSICFD